MSQNGHTYRRVAVIGAGPSGYAAARALALEKKFDVIRVFERRDKVGGIWHFDPLPDEFPLKPASRVTIPPQFPTLAPPAAEDITARTALYEKLDSNVGAEIMAFSHAPFPLHNSAVSVLRLGHNNASRPFQVVQQYLETLFQEFRQFVSLSTTVERAEKKGDKWILSLRQPGHAESNGQPRDFWWQENFDAVVVATGHYNVGAIPNIEGINETYKKVPVVFEHSKSYRSPDNYVAKKVVVVGGNISAADIVTDLHAIVKGPLYSAQRGLNEKLIPAWNLPGVVRKPQLKRVFASSDELANGQVGVEFSDGEVVTNVDKIIFATGFRVAYPFIQPNNPVTSTNRLDGVYEHIVRIGDPSLAFVGQVKGGLSFRVYEYQAVAIARILAGRANLPSVAEQKEWEKKRLSLKGDSVAFHEILPDFGPYWNRLREIAGKPSPESNSYELPEWQQEWADTALAILAKKSLWWDEQTQIARAKL
ncbi:dimethylaniline monooxygenase (N-oxide forming) [Talaromyces proteolyticus]|uniref:Dimethylaniline monooxygenase (N-oxide forming) n=1 Tax=Talaromyces proteolyticus TaxID=1131652 RepID=A0AAD4KFY5_9EURO|nr:dimethylaniline monooxygenase (N-oxide forming) [Talaromyces proteolyticus]KAH8690776.1 dimethylaniline monooxygenase (N-oxide forming) [Talaromyces proteolyticus]